MEGENVRCDFLLGQGPSLPPQPRTLIGVRQPSLALGPPSYSTTTKGKGDIEHAVQ
jgi:hypothetical protein